MWDEVYWLFWWWYHLILNASINKHLKEFCCWRLLKPFFKEFSLFFRIHNRLCRSKGWRRCLKEWFFSQDLMCLLKRKIECFCKMLKVKFLGWFMFWKLNLLKFVAKIIKFLDLPLSHSILWFKNSIDIQNLIFKCWISWKNGLWQA